MSLNRTLSDPIVAELLESKNQRYALIGLVGGRLSLLAASKKFRQEIGFANTEQLLIRRYGKDVCDELAIALRHHQGWLVDLCINGQWHQLKMWIQNGFGVLYEYGIQAPPEAAVLEVPDPDNPEDPLPRSVLLQVDTNGRIIKVSRSLARFLGQEQEDLAGVDAINIVFRTDIGQFKRLLNQIRFHTDTVEGSFRLRNTQNRIVYFDWTVASNGNELLLIGKASKLHIEEALIKSEERINSILESMDDAFFAIDFNGYISYINEKGAELLGKNSTLLLGRQLWDRAPHLKKTPLFKHLNESKGNGEHASFQWQDPQDETWYQVKTYPSQDLVSVFFTDINSIKQNESKMHHQATHDSLTGLPNRLALSQTLAELMAEDQVLDFRMGLLFIDLDGFKTVNDTLGHDCGDDLLVAVAKRLTSVVRKSDIVARLSGDEFVITLPFIADRDIAFNVGKKVVDAISQQPFILGENRVYVGASVGVSLFPDDSKDVESLLKHADIAMYQAKQSGKNTVRTFRQDMSDHLQIKVKLENDLHDALNEDRIELHYQPRFNAKGRVMAVEALARMRGRDGNLVPPVKFIPLAEETGLIVPLGEQVLRKACEWLAALNAQLEEPIAVSVNVSGIQLMSGRLSDTIRSILKETRIAAHLLELELTETVLMQHEESIHEDLNRLHTLGVELSIDDFGTGYSSLSLLQKMPVQTIKLDRSFVADLPDNQDNVIISRTVLAMANAMGLGVVAEGVETDAQRDFLIDEGILQLQGFGLARPMPAEDAAKFILSQQINHPIAHKIVPATL
ncbi:MAG TPA: EAL domain-containing protein [Limnobacter sp.]|uniref:putative bifunctional diguanylate cyclase/phosphodiesterase n=1 Tax=Limnobacter sp. TaxID=2003368 RepID=UPI002E32AFCC|nr:EAL domain-containing protein [Limnobacter sp.]HEX5487303.1 EAL domain-containing protein [Limnobacter sp.]